MAETRLRDKLDQKVCKESNTEKMFEMISNLFLNEGWKSLQSGFCIHVTVNEKDGMPYYSGKEGVPEYVYVAGYKEGMKFSEEQDLARPFIQIKINKEIFAKVMEKFQKEGLAVTGKPKEGNAYITYKY